MPRRSRFSAEERRAAAERAFAPGGSVPAVAAQMGVSQATIYRWVREPLGGNGGDPRPRLLSACRELLRDRTYADLTVTEVARAAGMSARAALHHFPSRRALFEAAVADAAGRFVVAMRPGADVAGPPLHRLGALAASAVDAAAEVPDAHVLFRDVGVPPPEDPTTAWHASYEASVRSLLEEAVAVGDLPPGFDTVGGARLFSRAAFGVTACLFEGSESILVRSSLERLPRMLVPRLPR